jgi:hypothetical protein
MEALIFADPGKKMEWKRMKIQREKKGGIKIPSSPQTQNPNSDCL